MKVAVAQISPVFLDRSKTLKKVIEKIKEASSLGCSLVGFSEGVVPGYPFWLGETGGSKWNDPMQKEIFAKYLQESVCIEEGHLDEVKELAKKLKIHVALGIIERPVDRAGHTLYCSIVSISSQGEILSVHRKLMPTYDERLVWGVGDGHGLVVHKVGEFTVGALNCWENWMPMVRASLYAQGENLRFANWPGGERNTKDITKFIALENRTYVLSSSGLIHKNDVSDNFPHRQQVIEQVNWGPDGFAYNGGSCICGPDGQWIVPPLTNKEALIVADLDVNKVYQERQNFDPSGHYSRPDVLRLTVNRDRLTVATFVGGKSKM